MNPTKEKKLTNMRSSTADELVRLIPPRPLSSEQALEFISNDECVEVTSNNVRLRKVELWGQAVGPEAANGRIAQGARASSCCAIAASLVQSDVAEWSE